MSEVLGVVVAHGDLAASIVDVVDSIAGLPGALVPVSNTGCSPARLKEGIEGAIGDAEQVIVFVDLASGSCGVAGRAVSQLRGRSVVVSGFNLATLLDFVFHRDMDLEPLARRIVDRGQAALVFDLTGLAAGADGAA